MILGQLGDSVKHPTSAQVVISRFVILSTKLGSVLIAQSLEPALDSVSPSLCPSSAHTLSLSKIINIEKKKERRSYYEIIKFKTSVLRVM